MKVFPPIETQEQHIFVHLTFLEVQKNTNSIFKEMFNLPARSQRQ